MGGVRVGSVVIDCNDFDRMFAFWRDALGYVPRDEPEDDWVLLHDPSGSNVNVSLQVVPEPRVGKNRLPSRSLRGGPGRRDRADRGARCDDPPQDPGTRRGLHRPRGSRGQPVLRHPEGRLSRFAAP